jgi:acetylornithine deacetylase/succinyl-diaminopimelate desuccinylase-like protein
MDSAAIKSAVAGLMPEAIADLETLVTHASCAFPGYPAEPVNAAAEAVLKLLRRSGFTNAELVEMGGYPGIRGEIPGPPGAPTVLMYGHYDVQPAPMEQGWETDPFTPVIKVDGRMYGRGAADDKSGVIINAYATRVLHHGLAVTLKVFIEGEEETVSHLEPYVEANPDWFRADAYIINDMGNIEVGRPVTTTALRGHIHAVITVRTLQGALHSGVFGGPAPDAQMALIRALDSLLDETGNVAVEGLHAYAWSGADFPEDLFRRQSGMVEGTELIGDGSIASRLWSRPSVTVIGMDVAPVDGAANVLIPEARARVALRIAPGQDKDEALALLAHHLERAVPWGAQVTVEHGKVSPAFATSGEGVVARKAAAALTDAFGAEPSEVGSGGTIPLLTTLAQVSPGAEFVLWGAEDVAQARIHGANESVDLAELERCIVAQALLLQSLGNQE